MYPTTGKGLKRLQPLKISSLRCCACWWFNQNSKGRPISGWVLWRKGAQQVNQPRWGSCLWSCCLSCHSLQHWRRTSSRSIVIGYHSIDYGNWNSRRSYDCFDSKKYHYPHQEITNLYNLFRQPTRRLNLNFWRWKAHDQG